MTVQKWHRTIEEIRTNVTQREAFLVSRINAETQAKQLLDDKAGDFEPEDLSLFLDLCNTEIVPPSPNLYILRNQRTRTRFQRSFVGRNRKLMLGALTACNYWLERLWNSENDPLIEIDAFWKASGNRVVKGAGSGLPTVVLYLREPKSFNVWIPSLVTALNKLTGRDLQSSRTRQNYELYNEIVNNDFRRAFKLAPQEIDYILWRTALEGQIRS
jgi:hypothetical protein